LQSLACRYSLYTIAPTLIEVTLVLGFLGWRFDVGYVVITGLALTLYVGFSVVVTEWRTQFRRTMKRARFEGAHVARSTRCSTTETVKVLQQRGLRDQALRAGPGVVPTGAGEVAGHASLLLNTGQQMIIAITWWRCCGRATQALSMAADPGRPVMVNAFLIQLYIPLNFLGCCCIRRGQAEPDRPGSHVRAGCNASARWPTQGRTGVAGARWRGGVSSACRLPTSRRARSCHDVASRFRPARRWPLSAHRAPARARLARLPVPLLRRGRRPHHDRRQDIRAVTQDSLRRAIGIVPQDTVLFNDTVGYNIGLRSNRRQQC